MKIKSAVQKEAETNKGGPGGGGGGGGGGGEGKYEGE